MVGEVFVVDVFVADLACQAGYLVCLHEEQRHLRFAILRQPSQFYAVQFFHHIDPAFINLPVLIDQLPDERRSTIERFHPVQHVGYYYVCLLICNGSLLLNVFKIYCENLLFVPGT